MPDIGLNEAYLVSLFLESALWGIFAMFYVFAMKALLYDDDDTNNGTLKLKRKSEINWLMVGAVQTMFVVGTFDVSVMLYQCILAFARYREEGGPGDVLNDESSWVNIAKIISGCAQGLIADTVLIYRCWLVYNRRWTVVALPIVLYVAATSATIAVVYFTSLFRFPELIAGARKGLHPLLLASFGCGIALNVLTTGLIVYRIWRVDTKNRRIMGMSHLTSPSDSEIQVPLSGLRRAMFTMVESGTLYTSMSLITFITYAANTRGSLIASHMQVQGAGIAFTMIILRASCSRSQCRIPERPTPDARRSIQFTAYSDTVAGQSSELQISLRGRELETEETAVVVKHDDEDQDSALEFRSKAVEAVI